MPVSPTYPGIYIEEIPNNARTITAAPTSITLFIGYTHPYKTKQFGKPVRIFSFADYEREFGGAYQNQYLNSNVAYAVQQFFLNGGSDAYVYGIEPRVTGPAAFPVPQAMIDTTVVLKAKEPVDAASPMTVTVSNVTATPTTDVADVTIAYAGRVVEVYRGVKFAAVGSTNSIFDRLKDSALVSVSGTASGGPVAGTTALTATLSAQIFLATDFSVFAAGGALDKIEVFNLLVMPDLAQQTASNQYNSDASAILASAIAFCERKQAFFIVDAPAGLTTSTAVSTGITAPTSMNAAVYFPHLASADPLTGKPMSISPSGTIAGIFARTDTNRGVWKAPAGLETTLRNVTGVVDDGVMSDGQAGVINERAINAIRTFSGVGTVCFGARTFVGTNPAFQQWKYVPVRRMALFIEQTLYRNLGWAIFEPNDVPLWTALRTSIEAFMLSLFRQGAFQGTKPSEAFFVQCDSSTTTQTDIDNGKVNIVVGFRPLKPAEFVIVKLSQLAGQVQA